MKGQPKKYTPTRDNIRERIKGMFSGEMNSEFDSFSEVINELEVTKVLKTNELSKIIKTGIMNSLKLQQIDHHTLKSIFALNLIQNERSFIRSSKFQKQIKKRFLSICTHRPKEINNFLDQKFILREKDFLGAKSTREKCEYMIIKEYITLNSDYPEGGEISRPALIHRDIQVKSWRSKEFTASILQQSKTLQEFFQIFEQY